MRAAILAVLLGLPIQANSKQQACTDESTAQSIVAGIHLQGTLAIVTGGDSGLGYSTAEALAKQGAAVVIAGHSADKSASAARNISTTFGVDARGLAIDLANFSSVRSFVTEFRSQYREPNLRILINDAGITTPGKTDYLTADGYEALFQTDYLGHFLLTELLLPLLRKNAPSRVVNVASTSHYQACSSAGLPEGCFKDWSLLPPPVLPPPASGKRKPGYYGVAKFAQIQHAAELAKREAHNDIMAFSGCPGFADTPLSERGHKSKQVCEGLKFLIPGGQTPCPYTADQGAAVFAYLATNATHSGGWYTRYSHCEENPPVMMHGFTEEMRAELYNRSLQWVGLAPRGASEVVMYV